VQDDDSNVSHCLQLGTGSLNGGKLMPVEGVSFVSSIKRHDRNMVVNRNRYSA
jgi:hypothetical protein